MPAAYSFNLTWTCTAYYDSLATAASGISVVSTLTKQRPGNDIEDTKHNSHINGSLVIVPSWSYEYKNDLGKVSTALKNHHQY